MFRNLVSQITILKPIYLLLEVLVRLFTLGIFSVEGGAKAWFEVILVTAALCASGYILWWQIPLLIAAIILATLAAGMFSVLAPQYLEVEKFQADKQISSALLTMSKYNLNEIYTLSGGRLEERLEQLHKAQKILEKNPKIVEQISELQLALTNINQSEHFASEKLVIQRETYARQQQELQELEKKRKEAEERKRQEEADLRRQEWRAYQERLRRDAELKAQQEKLRQEAKEKEKQEASDRERARLNWLYEQRRRENFTGGCPPDNRFDPPRCRPGYPVKVTLNKKEDGFDGIIWKPSDAEYDSVTPKWCYRSVPEAEAERGKYRFRRPKNSQGELRP